MSMPEHRASDDVECEPHHLGHQIERRPSDALAQALDEPSGAPRDDVELADQAPV